MVSNPGTGKEGFSRTIAQLGLRSTVQAHPGLSLFVVSKRECMKLLLVRESYSVLANMVVRPARQNLTNDCAGIGDFGIVRYPA